MIKFHCLEGVTLEDYKSSRLFSLGGSNNWPFLGPGNPSFRFNRNKLRDRFLLAIWKVCESLVLYPRSKVLNWGRSCFAIINTLCFSFGQLFFVMGTRKGDGTLLLLVGNFFTRYMHWNFSAFVFWCLRMLSVNTYKFPNSSFHTNTSLNSSIKGSNNTSLLEEDVENDGSWCFRQNPDSPINDDSFDISRYSSSYLSITIGLTS